MSELIKAVVSIKDPFALLAFFAVVLLVAFRTRTVPESLFGLLREKITRDRTSARRSIKHRLERTVAYDNSTDDFWWPGQLS